MSFAITGMGRSGTKFLSHELNRSQTWAVMHEPVTGRSQSVREMNHRFKQGNYGEVNSYLRWQMLSLVADYRAVIVRDPMAIYRSMHNRGLTDLRHLNDSLKAIDGLIQAGLPVIRFSQMTTDTTVLQIIARRCGIKDLPETSLEVRNASTPSDVPPDEVANAEHKLAWFVDEYRHLF